jgi:hypothetical protein
MLGKSPNIRCFDSSCSNLAVIIAMRVNLEFRDFCTNSDLTPQPPSLRGKGEQLIFPSLAFSFPLTFSFPLAFSFIFPPLAGEGRFLHSKNQGEVISRDTGCKSDYTFASTPWDVPD